MAATEVIRIEDSILPRSLLNDQSTERIDVLMDQWCKELKANVVSEFFQFRTSFEKRQKMVIQGIQSKTPPEVIKMRREMENLRELLHTLERSVSQKDKLVTNLVKALEKEKDKYEKLRAVSSDRFETCRDGPIENINAAEKQYQKALLSKCWVAWKEYAKNKDDRSEPDPQDDLHIVEVKIEEGKDQEENEISDDNTSHKEQNIPASNLAVSSTHYAVHSASSIQDIQFPISGYSGTSYPSYQTSDALESHTSFQPVAVGLNTPSFARISSSSVKQDNSNDNVAVAGRSDELITVVQPNTSDPQQTGSINRNTVRLKRKQRDKTAYERGKKTYALNRKSTQKNVKGVSGPFSVADGRPTMAMNVFQISEPATRIHPTNPMSTSSEENMPQNINNANMDNPFKLQHEQYINPNPDESAINHNPDPRSSVMDAQSRLGGNPSNWEAAKNNISQYVNQNPDESTINHNPDPRSSVMDAQSRLGGNPSNWEAAKNTIPQYVNQNPDESTINHNPDPRSSVMDAQSRLGGNPSNWEAAKNNISQYVNHIMEQGDNTAEEKNWQMQENWTVVSMGNTTTKDEQMSATGMANEAQGSQEDGLRCGFCAHTFHSSLVLEKHVKICPGKPKSARRWVCKECGKCFVSGKRYLEDHIKAVHRGAPPHRCNICSKGFTSLANFKTHLLIHGKERPYNCMECAKGFAQKGNFIRHMRVIHGQNIVVIRTPEISARKPDFNQNPKGFK